MELDGHCEHRLLQVLPEGPRRFTVLRMGEMAESPRYVRLELDLDLLYLGGTTIRLGEAIIKAVLTLSAASSGVRSMWISHFRFRVILGASVNRSLRKNDATFLMPCLYVALNNLSLFLRAIKTLNVTDHAP